MPHWTIAAAAKTTTTTTDSTSSNPFQSVLDFFKSPTWHFITLMFIFFLVVLWLACAYWVFKDARRRIDDKIVLTVAVLTGSSSVPSGSSCTPSCARPSPWPTARSASSRSR